MLNALLLGLVSTGEEVADSVYPVPTLLRLRLENVAIPLTGLAAPPPLSTAPPGLLRMDIVIWFVALVTTLPAASSIAHLYRRGDRHARVRVRGLRYERQLRRRSGHVKTDCWWGW